MVAKGERVGEGWIGSLGLADANWCIYRMVKQKGPTWDFPGGAVVKNMPANAGDTGSSSGPGRSHMPQSN